MSLTPQEGRRSRQRRLYSTDVADLVTMQPFVRPEFSRSRNTAYQPSDSLYDGNYRPLGDLSVDEQNNTHLAGSSRYNSFQGHHSWRSRPHECVSPGPSSAEIITMLQEQQQLLRLVLDTAMQLKQVEFDSKLQELAKRSDSSSSSPDVRGKNKCRIKRVLPAHAPPPPPPTNVNCTCREKLVPSMTTLKKGGSGSLKGMLPQ